MRRHARRGAIGGVVVAIALAVGAGERGAAHADEAALKSALGDYASGFKDRGQKKLSAYLETGPSEVEVERVLSKTSEATVKRVLALGGDHQALMERLLVLGKSTERVRDAVEAGLRWLATHPSGDGSWNAKDFGLWCDGEKRAVAVATGAGKEVYTVGVTGLALTAFLEAGCLPTPPSPHAGVVEKGLDFLVRVQDAEGCFGARSNQHYVYNHGAALHALVLAAARTKDPSYVEAARKGVEFVLLARNPTSAWRYGVRPGESDTSVTAWNVVPLVTARDAALDLAPAAALDEAFEGARKWIESMTDARSGEVGYTARGSGAARTLENVGAFPSERTESMAAAAAFVRLAALGQDPTKVPSLRKALDRCLVIRPTWKTDGSIDLYYWHYASRAFARWGGVEARRWRLALISVLVPAQRKDSDFCGHRGSWDPLDPWSPDGGRIYVTALAISSLVAGTPVVVRPPSDAAPGMSGAK